MSDSYRVEKQEGGSYIVRLGWKAVAYKLSEDEKYSLDIMQHQMGFAGIILGVTGILIFSDQLVSVEYLTLFAIIGALVCLFLTIGYIVENRLARHKEPLDNGLPYIERLNQQALHRWEKSRLAIVVPAIGFGFITLFRPDPWMVCLTIIFGLMLLQCLYFRFIR